MVATKGLALLDLSDLRALLTPTRHGSLVAAGIPWFVAPFGRDSLLTCHQTLMINPDLTRTTLRILLPIAFAAGLVAVIASRDLIGFGREPDVNPDTSGQDAIRIPIKRLTTPHLLRSK